MKGLFLFQGFIINIGTCHANDGIFLKFENLNFQALSPKFVTPNVLYMKSSSIQKWKIQIDKIWSNFQINVPILILWLMYLKWSCASLRINAFLDYAYSIEKLLESIQF